MKYSIWQGIVKFVKYFLLFAIGSLIAGLPIEWKELSVGGLLVLLYNYLKVGVGIRFLP